MEGGGRMIPKRAYRRERCRRRSRLFLMELARRSWSDVPAVEILGFREEKRTIAGEKVGWSWFEAPAVVKFEKQTRNAIA